MISSRKLCSFLGCTGTFDFSRRLFYGSGVLLGSTLIVNNQGEQSGIESKWKTIEYPSQAQPKKNDILLSRKIVSSYDKTDLNLRLYQYQTCPYCCKLRAFLDYHAFSYEVVEVNPVTRSQIKFSDKYKKVPILTSTGCAHPLIESSLIISVLATYLLQKKLSLNEVLDLYQIPEDGKQLVDYPQKYFLMAYAEKELSNAQINYLRDEREWREWVDNHFIHIISPNVYRTWSESLETFKYFDKIGEWKRNFPMWERFLAIYVGAAAMYFISKRLKKRHNIVDERKSMKDAFEEFLQAKGDRPFMGGDNPNLADLALFGTINSFCGCSTFKEMRQETRIGEWFDAVQTAISEARGKKLIIDKCA